MNKIFKLALRNLSRQKRRNVILALAIAFGFFVVTGIDGLITGMVENLEDMITQVAGGTVLIGGYEKIPPEVEGGKGTVINIVRDKDYIENLVQNSDIDYKYVSKYTSTTGQMIFNGKKSITRIYGRDFSDKNFLDSFQLVAGSVESLANPSAMIINSKIAESLNLQIGDEVMFITSTIYGQNNVADFTIGAISKANSFVDSMQVFVNIETLNEIVGIPEGGYSTFTVYLKNKKDQVKAANKIEELIRNDGVQVSSRELAIKTNPANPNTGLNKQFLPAEYQWEGVKYGVECLEDAFPMLKTVMSVVHVITTVILIVILLIVMVGVSNTYRMVLYERIREIGTMRALGMSGKDTGKVFTVEALILCILGALAGLLLAGFVMFIVHLIPIHYENLAFFLNKGHFSFTLSLGSIIVQYLILIILTALAVRGTAKKAASLSPAEALRTVK